MHRRNKLSLAVTRPVLGAVAGLLVLVFGTLASGAALHHALHHHADDRAAHCVVCAFAKTQVEVTEGFLNPGLPTAAFEAARVSAPEFPPQNPSFLLPPGRAPPVLTSVS